MEPMKPDYISFQSEIKPVESLMRSSYESLMHKNCNNVANGINCLLFDGSDKLADARVITTLFPWNPFGAHRATNYNRQYKNSKVPERRDTFTTNCPRNYSNKKMKTHQNTNN